jgi:cold shock protein
VVETLDRVLSRAEECSVPHLRGLLDMSLPDSDRIVGAEGVVKWFDPKKGFGFIVGPDGQDIFAHFSRIEGDGFRVLKDGSKVTYDAERGTKGWHATRVVRSELAEVQMGQVKRGYSRTPRR